MPIIVRLDVMLALRKVRSKELAARVGITESNLSLLKSGRVRVVAVTTATRSFVDKSWPTMMESGVPGVSSSIWTGIFAPKGTPKPIIDKVYADIAKALKMQDVKARFAAGGGVTVGMPPAEFAAAIRKEAAALKVVVAKAGVKAQ